MFKNKTFSNKLRIYLFISSAIAVVFISSLIYIMTSRRMYDTKLSTVKSEISLMSGVIDDKINSLNNIAKYLATNNDVQAILTKASYSNYGEKFDDVQTLYKLVNSVEVRSKDIPIYIMSLDNPLAQYSNQENFEGVFADSKGYAFNKIVTVAENRHNNGFYIHRRIAGKENKDVVLTIVQKVIDFNSDKTVGYVFIDVYDEYFDTIIQDNFLGANANIVVMTEDGIIITDKNEKTNTGFLDPYVSKGNLDSFEIDKKDYFGNYYFTKQLTDTKFFIQELVPKQTLNEEGILLFVMIGLSTLAILALSSFVTKYISNIISKPIQKLSESMNQVELGTLDAYVSPEGTDEIAVLGKNFNKMLDSINELIDQVYLKQVLLNEAEIKLLKSKMNPHFINNTIESIKWLIKDGENQRAVEMLGALGNIIKENVNDNDKIPLIEDLIFINNYILIQKVRFQDKLDFQMEVDESLFDVEIPRLLIQPLVENAIIHGIEPLVSNGKVLLSVTSLNGQMVIQVSDNGPGIGTSKPGNQMAINNIKARLQLYYGSDYAFSLFEENGLTISEMKFPLPKMKEDHDETNSNS